MKNGDLQPLKMNEVLQVLPYMDHVTVHHINCAENMIQNTNCYSQASMLYSDATLSISRFY
jgi:hypothetical protein